METTNSPSDIDDITIVPRSKSSDLLKKDTTISSGESTKTITRSHFNTLKQWGKNRLKFMNRSNEEKKEINNLNISNKVSDIDYVNNYETNCNGKDSMNFRNKKLLEKERKLSHERKPSYSSSEKSMTIIPHTLPASINPVKLRESSSIRRQRRNGLGYKDEPNSSSGNWSASSESGRTSIGSEITAQPKSSASSNSLNHTHHLSSGPPSSIISRRRFLNTSASSSVTSEGTITPDLQHPDIYDDETSSAYSCDTEGYYTSFHVDSGLKTLKEEEPPTPLHTSSALSSNNSFGSTSNQTVLSAENEYELFGRGSTSTTTSSAGTVCTTLMASGSDRNLVSAGVPAVPERKSSLPKLNRSNSNASSGSLERSYSSSTVGSTLERMGTIKRNGVLIQKDVVAIIHQHKKEQIRTESPDSGNNTSSPVDSNTNSSPTHGVRSNSEQEYSEPSDVEGSDRIERIRVKTTINTSRIPSMCVITPLNSDDESQIKSNKSPLPQHKDSNNLNKNKNPTNVQIEIKKENSNHFRKATLLPLNNMLDRLKTVLPTLNKKSPNKDMSDESLDTSDPLYDTAGEYVTISDVRNNNRKLVKQFTSGSYYSNDLLKNNLATILSGNLNEETEYVSLNELPCNIRKNGGDTAHSINFISEEKKEIDNDKKNNKKGEYSNLNEEKYDEGVLNRRGARVTLDAQGKVIYSSDSLKRRKGAHTTFAPGPCVKENNIKSNIVITEKLNCLNNNNKQTSSPLISGVIANRKLQPVRPVVKQISFNKSENKNISASSLSSSSFTNTTTITTTVTAVSSLNTQTTTTTTTTSSTSQIDKIVIRAQQGNNSKQEVMRMTPVTTVIAPPPSSNNFIQSSNSFNNHQIQMNNTTKGAYVNIQDSQNHRILSSIEENEYKGKKKSNTISNNDKKSIISQSQSPPITKTNQNNEKNSPIKKKSLKTNNNLTNNISSSSPTKHIKRDPNSKVKQRKLIKRSDSYRKANSPSLSFKYFDSFNCEVEKFHKELNAELWRERINYPSTVSPKLQCAFHHQNDSDDDDDENDCNKIKLIKNSNLSTKSFGTNYLISEDSDFDGSSNNSENFLSTTNDVINLSQKLLDDLNNINNSINNNSSDFYSDEDVLDSDSEILEKTKQNSFNYNLTPSKVTIPDDCEQHRARVLSFSHTDIW